METHKGKPAFHAESRAAWRQWLEENHREADAVWLIIYRKESSVPSVYYPEAVDEALCYGWIDSTPNKRDAKSYYQYFSKRKPKSNWSKVNKDKVAALMASGLMRDAGLEMVALAKQNGTWTALDDVDKLIEPPDLKAVFEANPKAYGNWLAFAPSTRRGILEWILNAKTQATRLKRIEETVRLAGQNEKANQYVRK